MQNFKRMPLILSQMYRITKHIARIFQKFTMYSRDQLMISKLFKKHISILCASGMPFKCLVAA